MSLQNPPAGYPVMSGIILTTLITAIVHLSFGIPLFVLNGLGYLGLLVLLYAPLAALERFRPAVRYVLIGSRSSRSSCTSSWVRRSWRSAC